MKYQVYLIQEAEQDIYEIFRYILKHDSKNSAQYVLHKIKEVCDSLDHIPERGHFPPELERIGITTYRELHFKPYRIIYEIENRNVFIHCVLDGRRDLQSLLERRLYRK